MSHLQDVAESEQDEISADVTQWLEFLSSELQLSLEYDVEMNQRDIAYVIAKELHRQGITPYASLEKSLQRLHQVQQQEGDTIALALTLRELTPQWELYRLVLQQGGKEFFRAQQNSDPNFLKEYFQRISYTQLWNNLFLSHIGQPPRELQLLADVTKNFMSMEQPSQHKRAMMRKRQKSSLKFPFTAKEFQLLRKLRDNALSNQREQMRDQWSKMTANLSNLDLNIQQLEGQLLRYQRADEGVLQSMFNGDLATQVEPPAQNEAVKQLVHLIRGIADKGRQTPANLLAHVNKKTHEQKEQAAKELHDMLQQNEQLAHIYKMFRQTDTMFSQAQHLKGVGMLQPEVAPRIEQLREEKLAMVLQLQQPAVIIANKMTQLSYMLYSLTDLINHPDRTVTGMLNNLKSNSKLRRISSIPVTDGFETLAKFKAKWHEDMQKECVGGEHGTDFIKILTDEPEEEKQQQYHPATSQAPHPGMQSIRVVTPIHSWSAADLHPKISEAQKLLQSAQLQAQQQLREQRELYESKFLDSMLQATDPWHENNEPVAKRLIAVDWLKSLRESLTQSGYFKDLMDHENYFLTKEFQNRRLLLAPLMQLRLLVEEQRPVTFQDVMQVELHLRWIAHKKQQKANRKSLAATS